MRHHTKDKGDKGLGFIVADLLACGIQVALPISEHLPFDCIAISESGQLSRVSAKYRALDKHGLAIVNLRSVWADRHGVHTRYHNKTDYDVIAIYCPNSNACYYIKVEEVKHKVISLRVLDPLPGGRQKTIHWAKNYQPATRIFVV